MNPHTQIYNNPIYVYCMLCIETYSPKRSQHHEREKGKKKN